MGKDWAVDGEVCVAVHSPTGKFLYSVPLAEGRALVRSHQARRLTTPGDILDAVELKQLDLPHWMGGNDYVHKEFLPSDHDATCWCYALDEIPDEHRELFGIAVRECIVDA